MASELKRLTEKLEAVSLSGNSNTLAEVFSILKTEDVRAPQLVMSRGLDILAKHGSKLGTRVWDLREQVFLAGLDCGCHKQKQVLACFNQIKARFPDSQRVRLIEGQYLEAEGKHSQALKLYSQVLDKDPTNVLAMKRRVSVYKSQDQLEDAIRELNSYLEMYSGDASAWQELSQFYIQVGKIALAKFCVEELILLHPEHYLYHLLYAELCHSNIETDKSNAELARQYYAQALELKPDSMRALLGLCSVIQSQGARARDGAAMQQQLLARIEQQYRAANAPQHLIDLVSATLSADQASSS